MFCLHFFLFCSRFRWEQLYDHTRVNNKKTLMPKMQNSQSGEPQQMVEQSLFDIYLCDNCEAELYSLDAYQVSGHSLCGKSKSQILDIDLTKKKLLLVIGTRENLC